MAILRFGNDIINFDRDLIHFDGSIPPPPPPPPPTPETKVTWNTGWVNVNGLGWLGTSESPYVGVVESLLFRGTHTTSIEGGSTITNAANMFGNGSSDNIKITNLLKFDTRNITSMESMFEGCKYMESLDLSNFNTSKVTSMRRMFYNCQSLANLNVSSFDTSNVTDMESMFDSILAPTSLDLSHFDTRKVTNMSRMFVTGQLHTLDISNFSFDSIASYSYADYMFNPTTEKIYVDNVSQYGIDIIRRCLDRLSQYHTYAWYLQNEGTRKAFIKDSW